MGEFKFSEVARVTEDKRLHKNTDAATRVRKWNRRNTEKLIMDHLQTSSGGTLDDIAKAINLIEHKSTVATSLFKMYRTGKVVRSGVRNLYRYRLPDQKESEDSGVTSRY